MMNSLHKGARSYPHPTPHSHLTTSNPLLPRCYPPSLPYIFRYSPHLSTLSCYLSFSTNSCTHLRHVMSVVVSCGVLSEAPPNRSSLRCDHDNLHWMSGQMAWSSVINVFVCCQRTADSADVSWYAAALFERYWLYNSLSRYQFSIELWSHWSLNPIYWQI